MSEPRFRTREIGLILAVAVAATLLGLMALIFGFGLA